MTTNSSKSSSSLDHLPRARAWLPRSRTAWGILILGSACVAVPAYYTAGAAVLSYLCFDDCGTATDIGESAVFATVLALSPLIAVRMYQGDRPESAHVRLAAAAGLVLILALAGFAWTGS